MAQLGRGQPNRPINVRSLNGVIAGIVAGVVAAGSAGGVAGSFSGGGGAETHSAFADSASSGLAYQSDSAAVNVATAFYPFGRDDVSAAGVRVYVAAGSGAGGTGLIGYLMDSSTDGTTPDRILQTKAFGTVTPGEWAEVTFDTAEPLTASKFYWATVFFPSGHYSHQAEVLNPSTEFNDLTGVFTAASVGDLGSGSGNGSFSYGVAGTFPATSADGGWFGVDPVVSVPGSGPVSGDVSGAVAGATAAGVVGTTTGLTLGVFDGATGSALSRGVAGSFTPAPAGAERHTGFADTESAVLTQSNDANAVVMATAFYTVDRADVTAAGVRVFVPTGTGAGGSGFTGYLMDSSTNGHVPDRILQSVSFGTVTAGSWAEASFSSPVLMTANKPYWVAVHFPSGRYGFVAGGKFINSVAFHDLTGVYYAANADLRPELGNGSFAYGPAGTFPVNDGTDQPWYGVDAVVTIEAAAGGTNGNLDGRAATANAAGVPGDLFAVAQGTFVGAVGHASAAGSPGSYSIVQSATGEPGTATARGVGGSFVGATDSVLGGVTAGANALGVPGTFASFLSLWTGDVGHAVSAGVTGGFLGSNRAFTGRLTFVADFAEWSASGIVEEV